MSDLTSKFVSQSQLDEKRKKRQEEWEKVRQPHQPIDAPEEEEFDRRSLFDRLQEQKDKKQAEYDSQHQLKNQVRGIDNEEADFLEFVNQRQQELEAERLREEKEVLSLLHVPVERPTTSSDQSARSSSKSAAVCPGPKKRTQADILSKVIKRKRDSTEEDTSDAKKPKADSAAEGENLCDSSKPANTAVSNVEAEAKSLADGNNSETGVKQTRQALPVVIGILPGMGAYSNSSDSESSSSDSEIDTDMFRRTSRDLEKLVQAAHHQ